MNEKIVVTGRVLPISEATRKRNPHLLSMAQLRAKKSEPNRGSEGANSGVAAFKEGVTYSVAITCHRRRLLDGHDNLASSCKQLVDAITCALGYKDDRLINWEYHQVKSARQGTHVLITAL